MSVWDYLLLAAVAAAVVWAVRRLCRKRRCGGCCGCSGHCHGCDKAGNQSGKINRRRKPGKI